MSNYKIATKLKLRFNTTKGQLSTEQLWDLSLTELDNLAVRLEQEAKEGNQKSFLSKKTEEDKISKLRFDIALDILQSKVEEMEALQNAQATKEHNEKILSLIANKQDSELAEKSVEELKEMLK
jgi:hypothetical protein